MTLTEVVILAATQGITEFLPISSSGHLLVVRFLFGISDIEGTALDAFLHLGTLGALLTYYRQFWVQTARSLLHLTSDTSERRLFGLIVVATLPAVLLGWLWSGDWDAGLRSPSALARQFLLTAAVLLAADAWRSSKGTTLDTLTSYQALLVGVAQAVALVPAISRSGLTMAAGRWLGLDRGQAVRFSFLMAVPVLAGAGLLSVPAVVRAGEWPLGWLAAGFVVSWVSGWLAIAGLVKLVERVSLRVFVWYLVALAAGLWWYGSR